MEATCGICRTKKSNYTCPRCSILYCSLTCYRASEHLKCSEDFYKKCVEEEIKDQGRKAITKHRMHEILERVCTENNGLDSDDSSDAEELSERLAGVDLDSPDAVWARLSAKEKQEFKSLLESGKINDLIPDWKPWWLLQDIENSGVTPISMPQICEGIAPLSTVMKKKPSDAVAFGLVNILFGYVVVARLFLQDWIVNSKEAVKTLLGVAKSLSENRIHNSSLEAVSDAEKAAREHGLSDKQCDQAKSDTKEVMKTKTFMLAAVSDTRHLFDVANKIDPSAKRKYFAIIKKIEFYLSYLDEYGDTVEY